MARAELAGLGRATIEAMVSSGKLVASRGREQPTWRPGGGRATVVEPSWWLAGLGSRSAGAAAQRRRGKARPGEVVPLLRPLATISRLVACDRTEASAPEARPGHLPALHLSDRGLHGPGC